MESLDAEFFRYTLLFGLPAGTSRGTLHTKDTWFLLLAHGGVRVLGECAMFRGLSCDDVPDYEEKLAGVCRALRSGDTVLPDRLADYPSIRFGLEQALGRLDALKSGQEYLASDFTAGKAAIPVNGLVWMGSFDEMSARLEEKMAQGYRCIKIKIGAIGFDDELALLARIRSRYGESDIEIRVDANGAFAPAEALERIGRLADYRLHSIEQPIRAGQPEEMARICAAAAMPVALDEELIGVNAPQEKYRLLDEIRPQYIVIKPSLVGGIAASREWIDAAKSTGAGYWMTSALESNVGLDAIARFSYLCNPVLPQGLGTGALFTNNADYPFAIEGGMFCMAGRAPSADTLLQTLHQTNCTNGRQ